MPEENTNKKSAKEYLQDLYVSKTIIDKKIEQGEVMGLSTLNFHLEKGLEALCNLSGSEEHVRRKVDDFVKLYFKYKTAEAIWENEEVTVADAPIFIRDIMIVANKIDIRNKSQKNSYGVLVGDVTEFMEAYFRVSKPLDYTDIHPDSEIIDMFNEFDIMSMLAEEHDDNYLWKTAGNPSDLLEYACLFNEPKVVDIIVSFSDIVTTAKSGNSFDSTSYVSNRARIADWGYEPVIVDSCFKMPKGKVQRFAERSFPFNSMPNYSLDQNGKIIKR